MIEFIIANFGKFAADIILISTLIVSISSIVANWTKTNVDNEIVAKVSKVVNYLALNFKK